MSKSSGELNRNVMNVNERACVGGTPIFLYPSQHGDGEVGPLTCMENTVATVPVCWLSALRVSANERNFMCVLCVTTDLQHWIGRLDLREGVLFT